MKEVKLIMDKKYKEDTINYYDNNAEQYKNMWNIDFTKNYNFQVPDIFLEYLNTNAYILDLGCGAGRDSKYFMEKGYKVKSIDGSKQMCKIASEYLNMEVEQMDFCDLNYKETFDGIFACASLLHLVNEDLITCMKKIYEALKKDGILYVSFKLGDEERIKEGRYFNDMTEEKFAEICNGVQGFKILKVWSEEPYEQHKPFINFILRKV